MTHRLVLGGVGPQPGAIHRNGAEPDQARAIRRDEQTPRLQAWRSSAAIIAGW
jgi:hypothetical protein